MASFVVVDDGFDVRDCGVVVVIGCGELVAIRSSKSRRQCPDTAAVSRSLKAMRFNGLFAYGSGEAHFQLRLGSAGYECVSCE